VTGENFLVANGDTFFAVDIPHFIQQHQQLKSDCTIALKPMRDFDRYGTIELNSDDSVRSFHEKKPVAEGLINGGMYLINTAHFSETRLPEKFSFETGYLEKFSKHTNMFG